MFSWAAVTTSQGLLAPAGSAYCFLVGGLAGGGREGKLRTLEHGRSCFFQVTFLCDLLLLYVDREAGFYWRTKYEEVSCGPACVPELRSLCQNTGFCPTQGDVSLISNLLIFVGKSPKDDYQQCIDQASLLTC